MNMTTQLADALATALNLPDLDLTADEALTLELIVRAEWNRLQARRLTVARPSALAAQPETPPTIDDLVCPPKTGPDAMRVQNGFESGKDCHETQATHARPG
ncbi:MAG: hypothetical protein KF696_15165, partial [Planctomycetes bacterium]|nr:hypothetical protein [Planctomycetota bacterium]